MQPEITTMHRVTAHDRREIKHAPLPLAGISASGSFEGYASLFDSADLGRDVVTRGAVAESLRKRGPAGVKMLWQHDAAEPIGSWSSIVEDARGLKVRGQLNLAVARAREILSLMRAGAVDGLSIGFRTNRAVTDAKTGLRRLHAVDLWEISLVTFPMHPGARVTQVKRAVWPAVSRRRVPPVLDDVRRDLTLLRWRKDALAFEYSLRKAAPGLERRFSSDQPRDDRGRWTGESGTTEDAQLGAATSNDLNARVDDDYCEQQYELDNAVCRKLPNGFQRQKCWASSMERYAACLKGRPLTPLRY